MQRPSSVQTEVEAKARRACIDADKGIAYTVFYDLEKGDNYQGLVQVEFYYVGGDNVFFDWTGDTLESIRVNKVTFKPEAEADKTKVKIEESYLIKDSFNIVELKYKNRYYRDGEGIHTYIDTDGKQYIYTETEPFLQNRVIPCFDQPDLKGTYKRYFTCPADWVVVTTEAAEVESTYGKAEQNKEFLKRIKEVFPEISADKKYYEFLISRPLPTYLNSLFAGAFHRFDLEESKRHKNLPMAVYCRETLREFVECQLEDIFEYHKQSIMFYSQFFEFDYPFSKCDAIFCPEYRMGAMEYPGGITYSEQRYLFRTKTPSAGEKSERGRVIFHEMAHMWFGDTVTMKWWDGLWLNESFADFCCFEAWSGTQDRFNFAIYDGRVAFLQRKQWGYREDVMITTHPIQHSVADTLAAENIFDGITYPKGAACIKQLMTVLGQEKFKAAMVEYFQKFAFKNTTLEDLLSCCQAQVANEKHPIFDLKAWNESHLQKAGLNWVKAEWDPKAQGQGKLIIHQGSVLPEHNTLRYHKMGVAFVLENGQISEQKEVIITNTEQTEVHYNAESNPVAVLLNHGDKAFIRVIPDANTEAWLLNGGLEKLDHPLDRALYLKYLDDALKEGTISPEKYFPFALHLLQNEPKPQLLQFLITELLEIFTLLPPSNYASQVFNIIVEKLSNPANNYTPDMVAMLFSSLLSLAKDESSIDVLRQIIDGKSQVHYLKDFKYSLSQHWNIIYLCQASGKYTPEDKKALVDNLANTDKTDSKKEWGLKIQGLQARGEDRKNLINKVLKPEGMSYKEIEYLCNGLTSKLLPDDVREDYFEQYFNTFLEMFRNENANIAKTLRVYLMPSSASKNDLILERLGKIVSETKENEAALKKSLLMVVDTARRRQRLSAAK
jgi:aminopeptidase N